MPRKLRVEYEGVKAVCDYVHLNPVRAKLLKPDQALKEYRWSSWAEYLKRPGKRWPWLRVDRVLGEWGVQADTAAVRRRLEQAMAQRAALERSKAAGDWKALRQGWCWGPKGFREELLELIAEKQGRQHYGDEMKESDEQKTERLVKEMLTQARCTEADLKRRPQGRPEEGAHGAAIARGDDDDMGMDQQALADGALENGRQCRAKRMRNEKYTISHL
jgi:putative transposase